MSRYPGLPLDLILIRHGESEGNVADIMWHEKGDDSFREKIGEKHSYDYRLTKRGQRQAALTGAWMRRYLGRFDAFYTSDFARTKETAARLDLEGARWVPVTDLREQDLTMPDRSCMTLETARSDAPENFLTMLTRNHSGDRVVAVCHATVTRSFLLRLENTPYVDMSHTDGTLDQTVYNCELFWYTRKHPVTGEVSDRPRWKTRVVCYTDIPPKWEDLVWEEVPDVAKTSAELLAEVNDPENPLLIVQSVKELDSLIPVRAHNKFMRDLL